MNVSKKLLVGIVIVVLAVVALVWMLLKTDRSSIDPQRPDTPTTETRLRTSEPGQKKDDSTNAVARPSRSPREERNATQAAAPREIRASAGSDAEDEVSEERIKLVEAWEDFVDKVAEIESAPTTARALQLKREFDKLDKADQLDGIQTSLNLLPDEQFPLLYPILFDKTVDPDILDAIFSDGLNHDEEIKIPMMKEIYKDKTHPMWEEAERILEATGELDNDEPDEPDGDE